MSMIDDVVGKKLPTGRKFQAKVGIGNVQKKLREATRTGALKNLADNQDLINKIAVKNQQKIRRGEFSASAAKRAYQEAIKKDKTLTKDDKKDLKAILDHWSKGEIKSTEVKAKLKKVVPNKKLARAAAIKAELRPEPIRKLPDFLNRKASRGFKRAINPLSRQPYNPGDSLRAGSGGGINAAQGRGSLAGGSAASSSNKSSTGFSKPPSLLR